jgi:hypothetical protein
MAPFLLTSYVIMKQKITVGQSQKPNKTIDTTPPNTFVIASPETFKYNMH